MRLIREPERRTPTGAEYDVIVAGAGVSGCAAAIASARAGARTLLVERSGMLGGTATAGLMASITNFFFCSDGRQVVKGIAEEVVEGLVERGATSRDWRRPTLPQIPHDPEAMQVVLWEKLRDAGATVLLYTWVSEPIVREGAVTGLIVENKAGRQALMGNVVVDATGDVDVAYRAGVPCDGQQTGGDTMMFRMGNVDLQRTYEYLKAHPEDFGEETDIATPFEEFERNWLQRGIFHFPHGGGSQLSVLQEAIERGEYFREKGMGRGLDALGLFGVRGTGTVIVNSNFYHPKELLDIETVSRATLEGRERCLELAAVLRRILPGFEQAYVIQTASELGIRLTRWIQGEETVSWEDVLASKQSDRVVAVLPGLGFTQAGVRIRSESFDIPYGVMVPQKVEGLLVSSGKGISATREAHARIIRSQVSSMALGQAAGTAAALCAKTQECPRRLDVQTLQGALLGCGVYLGGPDKLARLGLEAHRGA